MSDRLASKRDEERQLPEGSLPSLPPPGVPTTNGRCTPRPMRHRQRRRRPCRDRLSAPTEALDGGSASRPTICVKSPDGALTLTLWPRPGGVVVQRNELRLGDRRHVQSMLFASAHAFVTWCETDQLRFAYPMLFFNLTRSGRELFDSAG